jgi:hypothetical protein
MQAIKQMSKIANQTIRKSSKAKAPYKELDPNMVRLVKALNSFEGIRTIGSCGGHPNPKPYQEPKGRWGITFYVDRTEKGWSALEFLVWLTNNDLAGAGHKIFLSLHAAPPFINLPGQALYFALDAKDVDPDELAEIVRKSKRELYLTPSE